MRDWLRRVFGRRSVNSAAEKVELRTRTVWVKPARARFLIDAPTHYSDEDEADQERFLADLMRESVLDENGECAFGNDPLAELDWQEFNRLRTIVLKWNTSGEGDPGKL